MNESKILTYIKQQINELQQQVKGAFRQGNENYFNSVKIYEFAHARRTKNNSYYICKLSMTK